MSRVTQKMLDTKVEILNKHLGRPTTPWTFAPDGTHGEWNVGNIHIHSDGMGIALEQICNKDGATTRPFTSYAMTNHECAIVLDSLCALAYSLKSTTHAP